MGKRHRLTDRMRYALPLVVCLVLVVVAALAIGTLVGSDWSWTKLPSGLHSLAARSSLFRSHPEPDDRGYREPCQSNARYLWIAATMYSNDHEGKLPGSLDDLRGYFLDWPVTCPTARSRGVSNPQGDYEYIGAGLRLTDVKKPATVPLAFDRADNHGDGTRNVVCVDGGVRRVDEWEFRQELEDAIAAGAYTQKTVEGLQQLEPWLKGQAGGADRTP